MFISFGCNKNNVGRIALIIKIHHKLRHPQNNAIAIKILNGMYKIKSVGQTVRPLPTHQDSLSRKQLVSVMTHLNGLPHKRNAGSTVPIKCSQHCFQNLQNNVIVKKAINGSLRSDNATKTALKNNILLGILFSSHNANATKAIFGLTKQTTVGLIVRRLSYQMEQLKVYNNVTVIKATYGLLKKNYVGKTAQESGTRLKEL